MELLSLFTVICVAVVLFHVIGYPIALFVVSRFYCRRVRMANELPLVSFVISAYNEADVIEAKLQNCFDMDYPANLLEIIVVADGSDDATVEIVKPYGNRGVTLLHDPERRGKSAAVNRGFNQAKGEVVVFSDANAFYGQDALKKLVRNFGDAKVGAVSGRKTVVAGDAAVTKSEGLYWRYESAIKNMESCISSTLGVVGEMIAVRRKLFTPIPSNLINDDAFILLSILRTGCRVIYEPKAVCWENPVQSMKDEVLRRKRINAGRIQFLFRPGLWPWNQPMVLAQFIFHKLLRLLLPIFMIGAFVGNTIVVLMPNSPAAMLWLYLAQCGFYGLALIGRVGEGTSFRWRPAAVAYYIIRSSFTSLEGLVAYLTGKQSVLWEKARGNGRAVESD